MASYVRKYSKNVPIYIIPNGVELAPFQSNFNRKSELRRKYNLSEDKIIVLYRGRFVSVKGFEELINAIEILNQKDEIKSKTEFLLVGDGPLREKAMKKLSKHNNCKIIEWTPRETLHELYIASDIFILPSKWHEAFPIVLLEAMAANLFIIASKRGSIPDILRGYSRKIYLKEPNAIEISRTLLHILYNWHKYYLDKKTNLYVSQFSWQNVVRKIYTVYILYIK
jgi:teichuronic acid biosynthesis glycosyltransferase TuaC